MNLRSMARALGGEAHRDHVLCPGPGHTPSDRSLSVHIDPNSPDLFRVHSFAGDDWRACRDYVRNRLGLPSSSTSMTSSPAPSSTAKQASSGLQDDANRIARALALWNEAKP